MISAFRFVRITLLSLIFIFTIPAFAQFESEPHNNKLQIGGWFGPVSPFPGTSLSDVLNINLGGGMFARAGKDAWHIEAGTQYHYYPSDGPEALHATTIYSMYAHELPFNLPISMTLGAGGGGMYAINRPERAENWLPAFIAGYEFSFPAGSWVNIGLRLDYILAWEKHLSPPAGADPSYKVVNGHFFQAGLMVNFNLIRN